MTERRIGWKACSFWLSMSCLEWRSSFYQCDLTRSRGEEIGTRGRDRYRERSRCRSPSPLPSPIPPPSSKFLTSNPEIHSHGRLTRIIVEPLLTLAPVISHRHHALELRRRRGARLVEFVDPCFR